MKRFVLASLILLACSMDEVKETSPVETPSTVQPEMEIYSLRGDPPPRRVGSKHNVEILSLRGKPPPLDLSDEAKGYLHKYGGWLTWKPDAPEGGQWAWEPGFDGCGKFMQHDQVANIAIILAGVSLEAQCRLCADRVRGEWEWKGCSCEAMRKLDESYVETENRLNRDGNTDHYSWYDEEECERWKAEMETEME